MDVPSTFCSFSWALPCLAESMVEVYSREMAKWLGALPGDLNPVPSTRVRLAAHSACSSSSRKSDGYLLHGHTYKDTHMQEKFFKSLKEKREREADMASVLGRGFPGRVSWKRGNYTVGALLGRVTDTLVTLGFLKGDRGMPLLQKAVSFPASPPCCGQGCVIIHTCICLILHCKPFLCKELSPRYFVMATELGLIQWPSELPSSWNPSAPCPVLRPAPSTHTNSLYPRECPWQQRKSPLSGHQGENSQGPRTPRTFPGCGLLA